MKKEFGKWLIDVTKYVTTVGLIAPFITKVESVYWYIGIALLVILTLLIGLYLAKEEVKSKKKK